jgi:hypothetical protein
MSIRRSVRLLPGIALLPLLSMACGESSGGGGDASTGPDATVGPEITQVIVGSAGGGATAEGVVTFGHPFGSGHAPESVVAEIDGQGVPTQVDVKRRHDDSSVRHAVISVALPALAAGEEITVVLMQSSGTPPGGGLTVAEALAGGFDAVIEVTEGGTTWQARASDLLQANTYDRWLDGSLVTLLRAAGPLMEGANEHPALWVLLDVTFQGPDAARVSFTLENAFHDTPGDRTYDVRILSGAANTVVFERTAVTHFHHSRWRHVHHWGAAVSRYHMRPDLDYLADVGVIPRYNPSVVISQQTLDQQWSNWTGSNTDILGNGIVEDYFPTTGGRGDIGPLPRWTATALISGDASAFAVMTGVGDLAGSFSVHYRDRGTGRAISIDDYPTITLNSSAAQWSDPEDRLPDCDPCSSPYTVDGAHQPSLTFVPYMLTGDPYYLDELYFWVSYNFIQQNFDYRGDDLGYLHRQQVRAQAWTLRTLAHTAWIAPDDHPETATLDQKVLNNLTWYQDNGVDSNPFGWWGQQSNWGSDGGRPDDNMDPDVRYYTSPWQSDFLIWAIDLVHSLGYAGAAPIRDWLAGYVVGRFTNGPDFNPYDGAPYHLAVISISGDPYDTWSTVWQMSFAGRQDPPPTSLPSASCALCYPAIARVALAAALHGGVTDAQTAYDFVDAELAPYADEYNVDPTWAIVP